MLAGYEVTAAVVVSEVDDLILGIDWLGCRHCRWSFAQNLIEIDRKVVRLISRPLQSMMRKIYAVENTVVPAGPTINVPVTMASSSHRQTSGFRPTSWRVHRRSRKVTTVDNEETSSRPSEGEDVFSGEAVDLTGRPVEESDLEKAATMHTSRWKSTISAGT